MIALAIAGTYLAILAVKRSLALRYARQHGAEPADGALPAATIVQPVLSGDPLLEATLARNVEALAGTAFVWLVDDDDAVARTVCAAVKARHALRPITVLICPSAPPNVNPKLYKLELARAVVDTEAFVVVDDDTVASAQGLRALLSALGSHDLTTGLPSYDHGSDVPSRLVAQFVNNNAALTYLTICSLLRPLTVNGMCYAVRCSTLGRIGGFTPLFRSLTDDLAIARAVLAAGGTIFQSPYPHDIHTTVAGWRAYAALMHRWFVFARLLLASEPPAVVALVTALYVVPPLLLWTSLGAALAAPSPLSAAACALVFAIRGGLLIDVQRRTLGAARHDWPLSALSELLQPLHAVHAVLSSTIRWRSRRYRVRDADDFSPAS